MNVCAYFVLCINYINIDQNSLYFPLALFYGLIYLCAFIPSLTMMLYVLYIYALFPHNIKSGTNTMAALMSNGRIDMMAFYK